jgi:hypothetical protein
MLLPRQRARAATRRLPMAIGFLAVAFLAGCDEAPTVGAPKTLSNVCERANDGKRVALEGYLALPSSFTEGISSESAPVVIRGGVPQSGDVTYVWIPYGSGPNSMQKVGDTYSQQDLKVFTKDGGAVGFRDQVRVSGTVAFPSRRPYEVNSPDGRLLDCGMNNPLIERL